MSEEDNKESPPATLGVPEKQPRDLGIHKIVFSAQGQGQPGNSIVDDVVKSKDGTESITIVQEDFSRVDKNRERKNKDVRTRIITASIICLLFVAMEFIGGYYSNSLVIAADAGQLLTVFSTLMVSLFALKLSGQRPGQAVPLGWYRAEIMAALVSVLTTWVLTSVVLYLAFDRLLKGNFVIDVDMMLATSAFGVVANLVMGMTLHNNCHVRYPANCGSDPAATGVNINVRAAFLHIVCDFMFSLGVFITALFIDCCPDWHIVDPISTFVFSIVVLLITLAILKDILSVLMEGMPKGVYFNDVLTTFLTIDGVHQVDNLRLWALSIDKIALSAHLTLRPGVNYSDVLMVASHRIHTKYDFCEMTIHLEELQRSASETSQYDLPVK